MFCLIPPGIASGLSPQFRPAFLLSFPPFLAAAPGLDGVTGFFHSEKMLLYIHVPFCRRKCRYCAFYSEPVGSGEGLSLWARALVADMRRRAAALGRPRVSTVFFGGGTPSLIPPPVLGRILDAAADCFSLDGDAEISMEANPDSVDASRAAGFRAAGVNRVSLGVQALDDALLAAIGRVHDRAGALRAFEALRRAKFDNVGLDFIWALPGETLEGWKAQLREAAGLSPEHLSCYGLTLEEGTPMFRERASLCLPGEEEAGAMYEEGGALLEAAGYGQYEISNYARPGRECRHNMGYWRGEEYLGLGPAAVSFLDGCRISEPADFKTWLAAVREGRDAGETERLSFAERAEELVMLRLRTSAGLTLSEYARLTGRDFVADNRALIEELERRNMAVLADGRFFLTRRGMLVSNAVIEQCFEHIPPKSEGKA